MSSIKSKTTCSVFFTNSVLTNFIVWKWTKSSNVNRVYCFRKVMLQNVTTIFRFFLLNFLIFVLKLFCILITEKFYLIFLQRFSTKFSIQKLFHCNHNSKTSGFQQLHIVTIWKFVCKTSSLNFVCMQFFHTIGKLLSRCI